MCVPFLENSKMLQISHQKCVWKNGKNLQLVGMIFSQTVNPPIIPKEPPRSCPIWTNAGKSKPCFKNLNFTKFSPKWFVCVCPYWQKQLLQLSNQQLNQGQDHWMEIHFGKPFHCCQSPRLLALVDWYKHVSCWKQKMKFDGL